MRYAYLGFYTLTEAQRAKELLELRSIGSRVVRMPSGPGISCAFGLKLQESDAGEARRLLEGLGVTVGKTVYRRESGRKP